MSRITSKYWLRFGSLGIALTASILAGAASGSCVFGTNINFCEQFGVHCEPGQQCAAHQAVCIPIGGCGDGIVSKGEMCDDGNIEDYMMDNGVPIVVNGVMVFDKCSHDCTSTQECGNGILDRGEKCDDGSANGTTSKTCDTSCKFITHSCGDSVVDQGEECDQGSDDSPICNGNNNGTPDPSISCHIARCGDGHTNTMAGEFCDNPGGTDTGSCNGIKMFGANHQINNTGAGCQMSRCGDGYANAEAGETCDLGGIDTDSCNGNQMMASNQVNNIDSACKTPVCGDGYVNIHNIILTIGDVRIIEECDLGNNDSMNCNGTVENALDFRGSGHLHPNDQRRPCHPPSCGDGYINKAFRPPNAGSAQIGEECDDGPMNNDDNPNACRTNCRAPHCGDGVRDSGEECDPPSLPNDPNDSCNSGKHCGSTCKCVADGSGSG